MTTVLAFSAEDVCRLTGLTQRQLRYWDKTGFFYPRYADENRRRPFGRIYSFRDLVGLKTLALLRDRVTLQGPRKVGAWLSERYEEPWARLRFYVAGRRVFFDEPGTGLRVAGRPPGQITSTTLIEMEAIARDVQGQIEQHRRRDPDQVGVIVRHRYVAHNAWVMAGTRIPTSAIWAFHKAGYATEGIIGEYPRLHPHDVEAAISFEESRRQERAS